ncbi:SDR family NAD(P)-dependent oxidoreductase [Streptomyces sp. S1A]|uniref:SDR family NAD(P)-dependent oxidoreductase n=1 Tax=Streptomyces sp. ICN903 TaxID=2964654 RepID=UPI001EDB210C|nr:SDR family NAD(P)-dependent oxidoreductase [Streptomyces sp. ICN903]MCG3040934.1 SDR family NAD(P)-dependent oxidoreductase [Streptomyces sp. ICN903]
MRSDDTGKAILATGASSGIGALSVRALALAGHTVYAGIRQMATRNATAVADLVRYGTDHRVDVHAVELDVTSQDSADGAIDRIVTEHSRLDVVVHNAGHMVLGAAEAFTAEQFAELYDVNVLGTRRVNRAALPKLREQGSGLLVWIGSSGTRPLRTHIDPSRDGSEVVSAVADRLRADFFRRIGLDSLLTAGSSL